MAIRMTTLNVFCQSFEKFEHGIVISINQDLTDARQTKLVVWDDNVIQVITTAEDEFSSRNSLIISGSVKSSVTWDVKESEQEIQLSTDKVIVKYNKHSSFLTFTDKQGNILLEEENRHLEANNILGEACYTIKQQFLLENEESLYGLGSYMDGDVRLNEKKVTMLQRNREDVVPVILSTNHYGLIWDNYSLGEFNDVKGSYYIWSEVADEINYFFIHGRKFDDIVSSYRTLTGKAPMYPKWVFGYIQSKQKYDTQEEVVSVVKKFRETKFPLDLIVQDWQYWPEGQWGQKSFNRANFPDPRKMMNDIHEMNAHIMISIWPDMADGVNKEQLLSMGGLMPNNRHLNVMSDEARKIYWQQARDSLFNYGIDAWWADCSEGYDSDWTSPFFMNPPVRLKELNYNDLIKVFGNARYINAYALMHTKGLYEGQRETTSDKRVYILTRSSYAGMQKYGASYWTGDVSANWEEFRAQIPAGINFCITGVPYWTTDIAGYFIFKRPGWWFSNGDFQLGQKDEGFNELYTRWFQFAAFCPLFRAHGEGFPREPWEFGSEDSRTYQTLLKFTHLRYRLLPYIYSASWKVTNEDYTIMRGLVFDFSNDAVTHDINNQYMFGQSFLVCPVDRPLYFHSNNVPIDTKEFTKEVYLPQGPKWFDFWTGKVYQGGQKIKADADYETMPLFVKAGSIVPMGPFIQYSAEATDPIEIRIYPGKDASFTLYEDEGDNYNYEKGVYSLININWDDQQRILTISDRKGEFPGMLKNRMFKIVVVGEGKGIGVDEAVPDKELKYSSKKIQVKL